MPVDYFLKLDGIKGDSLDDKHKGEFNAASYEFDLAGVVAATSGAGGAGKAHFSPLFVDLAPGDDGLAAILTDAASGEHIKDATFTIRKPSTQAEFEIIKLSNVTILGYDEKAGFDTRVALGYSKIEVDIKEQKPDGSLGDATVFSWDLNSQGGALDAPTAAELQPSLPAATFDYFLKLDGIKGDSLDDKHKGEFNAASYEFDLAGVVAATSGAGGAGKAHFSPLFVDLAPGDDGLAAILTDAASGEHIKDATFTIRKPSTQAEFEIIKLSNVTILGYDEKAGFDTRVALGYSKIEVDIKEQKPDGSLGDATVFSWDLNSQGGALDAPTAAELQPSLPAATFDYFLKLDGIKGDSLDDKHKGEFNAASYEFDLAGVVAATSGAGGAGKAHFSPLFVDLAPGDDGLAAILTDAASGEHIKDATFTIRKPSTQAEFEIIKLSNVTILGYDEKAGFDTRVALGYSKIEVDIKEQKPDGSLGDATVFSWDLNSQGGALDAPTAAELQPSLPAATFDYFLKLDGIKGDSLDDKHKGEFNAASYEFDLAGVVAATSGAGGAGKAHFSPLFVDLAPGDDGLAAILTDAASGEHIKDATFTIRKPSTQAEFEIIKLSNVTILGYDEKAGFDTRVALGYSKIEVDIKEQKPDGSLGDATVFSWDLNSQGGALDAPTAAELQPSLPAATFDYFLKLDGIKGDSLDDKHKGEFNAASYEFDLAGVVAATSGAGGAGKAHFSPLFVDLAPGDDGLAAILTDAASGEHIKDATFTIRKPSTQAEFEIIKLSNVTILGYDEKAGFDTRVALGYSKIEVDIKEQKPDGSLGDATVFSWDLNSQGGALDAPTAAELQPSLPAATFDYFLKLDGIKGDSLDDKHKGEFNAASYEFDLAGVVAATSGAGGAGKAHFSPLFVDLAPGDDGLAAILTDAASGEHIKDATFTIRKPSTQAEFEIIKLSNVTILGYDEKAGFDTRVALGYSKIEVDIKEQKPDGSLGDATVFSWDLTQNHSPVVNTPPVEIIAAPRADGSYDISGRIVFSDPDGDAATVSATVASIETVGTTLPQATLDALAAQLESDFQIDPITGAWTFIASKDPVLPLQVGESVQVTFLIAVSDNVPGEATTPSIAGASLDATAPIGLTATQTITITFNGMEDGPAIATIDKQRLAEAPGVTGSNMALTDTVHVTFIDADLSDNGHTAAITNVSASGATSGLALDQAGLLALLHPSAVTKPPGTDAGALDVLFSAPDKTFDYLAAGEKLTLSYSLAIDDHKGSISMQPVIFEITGSNDAPVITSAAKIVVAENKMAVGTITAIDPEQHVFLFELGGGSDQTFFSIDPHTGALSFVNSPDFETPEDANHDNVYDLVVSATDDLGARSTKAIHVSVTDVVEVGRTIKGGNGNDIITGTTGNDTIDGGNGADYINGGDGRDNLSGGNGDDTLIGGRGDDFLDAGNGDDKLDGGVGNNQLSGGNGNDVLRAGDGNNVLDAGNGDDTLVAGNGNNVFIGGNGNDTLTAANGNNSFIGGNGDDTFHVGTGNNTLTGGNGNDRFVFGPTFGKDIVADFGRGDHIGFDGGVFANFQAVQAAMHQVGADTVISLGADHSITLQHVSTSSLHASDFILS